MDIALIKILTIKNTNIAPEGKKKILFFRAVEAFVNIILKCLHGGTLKLPQKVVFDRPRQFLCNCRLLEEINKIGSEQMKGRGEKKELLDDIIVTIDKFEEKADGVE